MTVARHDWRHEENAPSFIVGAIVMADGGMSVIIQ
jgi:hypothetical protein